MLASFVIGFHTQRLDNLVQTLYFLEWNHQDVIKDSELILICQDECERRETLFFKEYQHFNMNLECMQLPFLTNFGVEKASCDKIVILESDRILPKGYFASVLDQLKEGVMITTKKMLKLEKPVSVDDLNAVLKGFRGEDYPLHDEFRSEANEIGMRNMFSGNTAIMKSDFNKAGKMDETYKGYGWADSDMTNAMIAAGVQPVFWDETELHLWHPQATYSTVDDSQMFVNNGLYFCKKWKVDPPGWFRQHLAKKIKVML